MIISHLVALSNNYVIGVNNDLPWKLKKDGSIPELGESISPYGIWISEVMLQQTQLKVVLRYWHKWMMTFPNLVSLSEADEQEVLLVWQGLGYYSRARNLLKSAKIIKNNFKNNIPQTYDELIQLPGIGDYTAKAILGIGYNKSVMPLDANIERILVRLHAIDKPINKVKNKLKDLGKKFISDKYSSNLIQSFMDYGSEICLPRNPKCNICGINRFCQSYKKNLQQKIPLKLKKKTTKPIKYTRAYVIVNEKNEILVRSRPNKGMLASMLEAVSYTHLTLPTSDLV